METCYPKPEIVIKISGFLMNQDLLTQNIRT